MKKILFLLILGVAIGYFVKSSNIAIPFLPQSKTQTASQEVQGASTSATRKDFSLIEKAIQSLSISDIATSSPQVQTVIHLLQKLPLDQAKVVCENACKKIQ